MRDKLILFALALAIAILIFFSINVNAEDTEPKLEKVRCTCYIATGNPTKSGYMPHEGIVASTEEHLENGDIAVLYTLDRQLIGFFECRDTGGDERIKDGTRIDIYRDSIEEAYEWVKTYGDYVLVEWVQAKG